MPVTALLAKIGLFITVVAALAATRVGLEDTRALFARELVAPPAALRYFTFGYNHALADSLWIRSLQDFDYCEKPLSKDLCSGKGWLYKVLDLITDLSPHFRMAYSAGAMALTVIVSDIDGASAFFNKAVLEFPEDWVILYKAAYHAIFEEKNPHKAADLTKRAAQLGAPLWVYSLSARLYTEAGQREFAIQMVNQLEKESVIDDTIIQRIKEKLEIQ